MKHLDPVNGYITLEHNGVRVDWDVTVFWKTRLKTIESPFAILNGFIERLAPNVQQEIWDCYGKLNRDINTINDPIVLTLKLTEEIGNLYSKIDYSAVEHYVQYHAKVRYPELKLEHVPNDPYPDKTYLREDYHHLVVLTILFRFMIPIWGEYMKIMERDAGKHHKEYNAMKLLQGTYLLTCKPVRRLMRYIEAHNNKALDSSPLVLDNLSSEQINEWLLSLICVRRIAVGDTDTEDRGSLITNIHGFMKGTVDGLAKRFGKVKPKHPEGGDDDREKSNIEAYKIRQAVSPGDVALFEIYLENPRRVIRDIDPTCPTETFDACFANMRLHRKTEICEAHIVFCQWVLHNVLPSKAFYCIDKSTLLKAVLCTQVLLWHWGWPDLALLCIGKRINQEAMRKQIADRQRQIKTSVYDDLVKLYPHTTGQPTTGRGGNMAHDAITMLSKELTRCEWGVEIPAGMTGYSREMIDHNGYMIAPSTISEQLAYLVIFLNKGVHP